MPSQQEITRILEAGAGWSSPSELYEMVKVNQQRFPSGKGAPMKMMNFEVSPNRVKARLESTYFSGDVSVRKEGRKTIFRFPAKSLNQVVKDKVKDILRIALRDQSAPAKPITLTSIPAKAAA